MLHVLLVSHFLFPKKVSCHFLMMRCILFSKYLGINRKRTEPAENGWCFKTKFVPKLWVEWLCFLFWVNFCFVLCLLLSCKNWTVSRRIYMEIITIGNSDPCFFCLLFYFDKTTSIILAVCCLIRDFTSWHRKCVFRLESCSWFKKV